MSDPYLNVRSEESIKSYYAYNGYVVIRVVIPAELCVHARAAYEKEVK
jgi:hypothetical protein